MKYPRVLLLGNGLNRSCAGSDWGKLIDNIYCNNRVSLDEIKNNAPFPIQAVLATDDNVHEKIKCLASSLYGLNKDKLDILRPYMEKLLELPFDYILTTNYSYEIEMISSDVYEYSDKIIMAKNLDKNERVEPKYLLHSYNQIDFHGKLHKVFHIHGEARKPNSIILGHYYYGELLSRYQAELSKNSNRQFFIQRNGKPYKITSWLDAFIMGDVYSVGFGFDFSEMDLWWLLCRKKYEKADHGKFVFYEPLSGNEVKHTLINCYDGETKNMGYKKTLTDKQYTDFYNDVIEDITKDINESGGLL